MPERACQEGSLHTFVPIRELDGDNSEPQESKIQLGKPRKILHTFVPISLHGSSHVLSSPLFFPVCCGSSHLQSPLPPFFSRESSSGLFARGRLRSTFAAPFHKSFPVSTCSSSLSLFFVLFSLAVLCSLGQSAAFAPPVRGRGMVPIEWQYLRWCWQGARVAPIGEAPVFSRA